MNKMTYELTGKLSDCEKRVDEYDVRQCVGEIEAQSCSGVMDELESMVACEADDLCD